MCICVYVRQGWGSVLIKYSGNVRLQILFSIPTQVACDSELLRQKMMQLAILTDFL